MTTRRLWSASASSSAPARAEPRGAGPAPPKRRALLVNLDFRDVIYSYLWGRAIVELCVREQWAVDAVTVNPSARRDVAGELGVAASALELRVDGTVVSINAADESQARAAIGQLLERHRYQRIILNCDASLFAHLMVDRAQELAATQWLLYDRHLHLDLPGYEADGRLRERIVAADVHVYTIQEIATDTASTISDAGVVGSLRRLGLTSERIHFQQWPLDDAFFAPQPDAAPRGAFVVFSGGDSGRDYATLFEAARGLPIQLRLCANSYPTPVPPNVTILPRLRLHEFRDQVARATAVVVPLTGHPLVSGITVIAMAKMMGKPVIASDNPVVRMHIPSQGDGGYLTQTGNAELLRSLLIGLIDSPAERERLGREARTQAVRDLSLRGFVDRMLALR